MKFCMNCGKVLPEDVKFCPACGASFDTNVSEERTVSAEKSHVNDCPQCGYKAKTYQAICPYCLYEFKKVDTAESVKKLKKRLTDLEGTKKAKYNLGVIGEKVAKYIPKRIDDTNEKINSEIRLFDDIPGKPVEVYGIMFLSASNLIYEYNVDENTPEGVEEKKAIQARNDAWLALLERAYEISKTAFPSTDEFDQVKEFYEVTIDKYQKAKRKDDNPVKRFKEQQAKIEEERYEEEKLNFFEKQKRKKIDPSVIEQEKATRIENKIQDLIRNFDVPNTPEDVFDFMVFAKSNIDFDLMMQGTNTVANVINGTGFVTRNDLWLSKIDQLYHNAKYSFGEEQAFFRIRDLYDEIKQKREEIRKTIENRRKKEKTKKTIIIIAAIIVGIIILALLFLGAYLSQNFH